MSYFEKTGKIKIESLMSFYDLEMDMMSNELVETLSPAIKSMEALQIVLEIQIELADYIKAKGKSPILEKSAKRLFNLLSCITDLNKSLTQLQSMKLRNKEVYAAYNHVKQENILLKKEIEKNAKTFEEL